MLRTGVVRVRVEEQSLARMAYVAAPLVELLYASDVRRAMQRHKPRYPSSIVQVNAYAIACTTNAMRLTLACFVCRAFVTGANLLFPPLPS